jgi:hypothetical protein
MLCRIAKLLIVVAGCLAGVPDLADSAPTMRFVYHSDHAPPPPGQQPSQRNQYTIDVLRTALDRTRDVYGAYELAPSPAMHEKFRPLALEHGDEGINISVFPSKPGYSDKLIPVRIPIDRGLMGFRILTIRSADQPRFDAIRSADDLKAFRFGLLGSWDDVGILQHDGLAVETGTSMEGLLHMLDSKRFDAFNNSAPPTVELHDRTAAAFPDLAIEANLMLHYPVPVYFWFRDTQDGRRMADRVRIGLESMVQDGTLKTLFHKWYGATLTRLEIDRRRVVELPNPQLDPADPLDRPALWYMPGESPSGP